MYGPSSVSLMCSVLLKDLNFNFNYVYTWDLSVNRLLMRNLLFDLFNETSENIVFVRKFCSL